MAVFRVKATPGQLAELRVMAEQGAIFLGPEEADGTCIVHSPVHSMIVSVGRRSVPVTPKDRIRIVPDKPTPGPTIWDILLGDEG